MTKINSENKTTTLSTSGALENLFERFIALSKKINDSLPCVNEDKDWHSEAIIESTVNTQGKVQWRPSARPHENIFSSLENALEITFHPDILQFYNSFWSDGLVTSHESGEISLIQIWNPQDEEMLKENLLGHAFAQIKNKLPITVFIGCTHDDEIISIDNISGSVGIEKPGQATHLTLANSVSEFINSLTPTLKPYD